MLMDCLFCFHADGWVTGRTDCMYFSSLQTVPILPAVAYSRDHRQIHLASAFAFPVIFVI